MKKLSKKIKILLAVIFSFVFLAGGTVLGINFFVVNTGKQDILTAEQASNLKDVDCIVVLGCQVLDDGTPCDMLADRLRRGVELYKNGASEKLLMSGDHGRENYNEVKAMKNYAINEDIESEDIFMDHAGFSTYESIYRAKEIFCAEKIIIVTQEYHLYRALYIAKMLGVEAYGVSSDYHTYVGQFIREIRGILARNKDFFGCIVKPEPTFLGETIPVNGNGDITNDTEIST